MTNINSEKLDKVIKELDSLLMQGLRSLRSVRDSYARQGRTNVPHSYIESACASLDKDLDTWYSSVYKVLDKELPNRYHLFHFIEHENSSSCYVGMPLRLSSKLVSFKDYLLSLEDY